MSAWEEVIYKGVPHGYGSRGVKLVVMGGERLVVMRGKRPVVMMGGKVGGWWW